MWLLITRFGEYPVFLIFVLIVKRWQFLMIVDKNIKVTERKTKLDGRSKFSPGVWHMWGKDHMHMSVTMRREQTGSDRAKKRQDFERHNHLSQRDGGM